MYVDDVGGWQEDHGVILCTCRILVLYVYTNRWGAVINHARAFAHPTWDDMCIWCPCDEVYMEPIFHLIFKLVHSTQSCVNICKYLRLSRNLCALVFAWGDMAFAHRLQLLFSVFLSLSFGFFLSMCAHCTQLVYTSLLLNRIHSILCIVLFGSSLKGSDPTDDWLQANVVKFSTFANWNESNHSWYYIVCKG